MLIQKIEIQNPIKKSSPRINRKLNHSSSSCQITSNHEYTTNKLFNLPYLSHDTKIKKDSIKLSHLSVYDLRNFNNNNINNNNSENLYIKYKPKRLIKIQPGKNDSPFQDFRYLPLNQDKVFKSSEKENSQKILNQQIINCSSKKADEFFDEDSLKLKKYAFRSIYMLKMEKNIQNFDKLKTNSNLITGNKLGIFNELTYKISKLMKSQKSFFFQNLYEINENSIDNSDSNKTPIPLPVTNQSTNFNNPNLNIDIEKIIKKEIIISCEYNNLINKLFSFLLNEISSGKAENFKLLQKNHEEEIIINSKTKSLHELNSYINRYDVNTKIDYVKKQEEKRKHLKEYYNIKENEYISQIYKLENEIKIMTTLLNKNKQYFNKCKEYAVKVNSNKKVNEEMKREFRSELREKNNLIILEKNKENELNEQLEDMLKIVENLKNEKSDIRKIDLIDKSIIKKLENKINEKNENIMMINEELEWYIRKNDNLKKILNDRESTIKTMEMKLNKENNINNNI